MLLLHYQVSTECRNFLKEHHLLHPEIDDSNGLETTFIKYGFWSNFLDVEQQCHRGNADVEKYYRQIGFSIRLDNNPFNLSTSLRYNKYMRQKFKCTPLFLFLQIVYLEQNVESSGWILESISLIFVIFCVHRVAT